MGTRLPKVVILDMAGTTIDEGLQADYWVLKETATAHGGLSSDNDVAPWRGSVKRTAFEALLSSDGVPPSSAVMETVLNDFHSRLAVAYEKQPPRPILGVPEALIQLRESGIRIAFTTGFERHVADSILHTLGWIDNAVADVVVCGDEVTFGRPAPYMIFHAMEKLGIHNVNHVLIAGDTPRDLQAGTNAGAAYVVGVLSGSSDAIELGRHSHTHLLNSVAAIPDLLGLVPKCP